ncbi:MAG: transporter substrate-binding domain-containing protein [Deltaproteobacteria bacterium]|nr:transporter substrate-binding domain-containing protein [Deltaproteobacteria bacterium]
MKLLIKLFLSFLFILLIFYSDVCLSKDLSPDKNLTKKVYKVAIRNSPPFIIIDKYNNLDGLSIDLWEAIARKHKISFEYKITGFKETLRSLKDGSIDVAISPLTITKEREERFDFSMQYFPSGLTFASLPGNSVNMGHAWKNIKKIVSSPNVKTGFIIFLVLFTLFIIFSFVNFRNYYGLEIDKKTTSLGKIISLFIISLFMTLGIDKNIFRFRSVFMQLFSLILVVFGITISAGVFGLVTATLTQSVDSKPHYDLNSIRFKRIAVMEGSTANMLLNKIKDKQNIEIVKKVDPKGTIDALLNNEADLILGDWAQLSYWANQKKSIYVQNSFMRFEPYGWGFPENSKNKEVINCELIAMVRNKEWWSKKIKKYLGHVSLSSLK